MTRATVVVPTHDHAETLHRHAALQLARGPIVCYLSDDDLWLPEHVETLERRLRDADLAHSIMVTVHPDGTLEPLLADAGRAGYAQMLRTNHGGFGLACGGHTLEAYRRLPEGWRPAQPGLNTDAHMWLQFLEQPWCRAASVMRPTALHFPSSARRDWPLGRRLEELDRWTTEIARPGGLEGPEAGRARGAGLEPRPSARRGTRPARRRAGRARPGPGRAGRAPPAHRPPRIEIDRRG